LATIVFNGDKYDTIVLDKMCSEGHKELVDNNQLVYSNLGAITKSPIAIKYDGKYVLLRGRADSVSDKTEVTVITKFTLKKCKIEPVQVRQPTQSVYNSNQQYNTNNRGYSYPNKMSY